MSMLTLGDEEVQVAIGHFIDEARICARTQRNGGILGLAAMSTILSCVIAVGESMLGHRATGEAIEKFFKEMTDKQSWFLPPAKDNWDESRACAQLQNVRNGLAHSLTMPPDVILLPNRASIQVDGSEKWRIVVPDFIDAVESSVEAIGSKYSSSQWDPGKGKCVERGPVAVGSLKDKAIAELLASAPDDSVMATGTGVYPRKERGEDKGCSTTLTPNEG